MLVTSEIILDTIILHKVGNKTRDEGIHYSQSPLDLDEPIKELLLKYFTSPFKSSEYYNLYHESDLSLNAVYTFVSAIFHDPAALLEQSENLARHLYEQSTHAKVQKGEFYVTYLRDCVVDGEPFDAIGLFKSESRDTYLKVYPKENSFGIDSDDGININKLDKGCLIFNDEKEKGFLVATVDNLNKGNDALYWRDSFLKVKEREDNYYYTQNVMSLCKSFITEKVPEEFEVSKADQANLLNRSVQYLREEENFDLSTFSTRVMRDPDLIETFKEYKDQYQTERNLALSEEFAISAPAVKKQAKVMRSVIKLDKNFHVYVHGGRDSIIKGYDDERGLHFYQLFFKEES